MGNWKLNGNKASIEALVKGLTEAAAAADKVEAAVCPPAIYLGLAESLTAGTKINLGSQDADVHTSGAFTGENSPEMIKEFGVKYSLVGHSERRTLHGETDEVVAAKFEAIQAAGLIPVLCIGETLEERQADKTTDVVDTQLKAVIDRCGIDSLANAVIAYEPVWAIGTGVSASSEQAQEVHAHIRQWLAAQSEAVAAKVQILYGGSVKAATAKELFGMADIDGGLVGGASLDAAEFSNIIAAAQEIA
jgi:triosephosphate isomerase